MTEPFFSCDEYECQAEPPHAIVAAGRSDWFADREAAHAWAAERGGTVVYVPAYDPIFKVRRAVVREA